MTEPTSKPQTRSSLFSFLRRMDQVSAVRSTSVSGGHAPSPVERKPLRAGVGLSRTPVPTVRHAPGTVPYFPPERAPAKVEVTEEVYRPWSFAVTTYGIRGGEVPRERRSAEVPLGLGPDR